MIAERRVGWLVSLLVVGVGYAFWAAPVAADCDAVMASFRELAPTASTVVTGDVVTTDPDARWTDERGRSSRFTLRVRHVLRGHADRVMTLRDRAFAPCADHIIVAKKGDRIALALDARSGVGRVDIAAWIRGAPMGAFGVETITEREAIRLMSGAPETSAISPDLASDDRSGAPWLFLVGGVAFVLMWRRQEWRARRGHSSPGVATLP